MGAIASEWLGCWSGSIQDLRDQPCPVLESVEVNALEECLKKLPADLKDGSNVEAAEMFWAVSDDLTTTLSIISREPVWVLPGVGRCSLWTFVKMLREEGVEFSLSRKGLQKAKRKLSRTLQERVDEKLTLIPPTRNEGETPFDGFRVLSAVGEYLEVAELMGNCVFNQYWLSEDPSVLHWNGSILIAMEDDEFVEAEKLGGGPLDELEVIHLMNKDQVSEDNR